MLFHPLDLSIIMSKVREEGSDILMGATNLKTKGCMTQWNKHKFQETELYATVSNYLQCVKKTKVLI